MESSSQVYGETEECCSSESGWTMYIASPMHEDDDDDGGGGGEGVEDEKDVGINAGNNDDGGDDNSDDSMASDASSGPKHQENVHGNGDQSVHGMSYNRSYEENNGVSKYFSYMQQKKANKQQMEKTRNDERRINKGEKKDEKLVHNATTSSVPPARKSKWFNKGK